MEEQTPIFALDIGTRSVIGVVLQPIEDGRFEVANIKIVEHKERSMLDGQIHDVLAVSDTIKKVKVALEDESGPLHRVSVAAAGRALRTRRVRIDSNIEGQPILRQEEIRALELSAVQDAQKKLIKDSEEDLTHYHCVGYSVVNYFLDNDIIGSLADQRGSSASVELIATFLPRVVVDSLISALNRVGLEMDALTLEPIAAIHVLIPPSMRKLNIAFVDIGAGTSDIAITDEGTVTAYGMVPVAGDEITEAISQYFLLDFNVAEEVKRKITTQEELTFKDILGKEYTVPSNTVEHHIEAAIDHLVNNIGEKILELNEKAPQAVMLVGGGSQTPRLTEKLSELLNIPIQRVAVRGVDAILQKVNWPDNESRGPEFVTPIGIGISSRENPIQYLSFYVNKQVIHLFEMKTLTVGDALIAAGLPVKGMFGKPGLAMTIKLNGQIKMIPGEYGTPPEITVNDEPKSIDAKITDGDEIFVKPGVNGKDASLTVKEALEYAGMKPFKITIDEREVELFPLVEINGLDAGYSSEIHDRDTVNMYHVKTIEEALVFARISTIPYTKKDIMVKFLDEVKSITYTPKQIYRNGQPVLLRDNIYDGDVITFDKESKNYPVIKDLIKSEILETKLVEVIFNGKPVKIEPSSFQVFMNNHRVSLETPIEPESTIEVVWGEDESLVFSDVFKFADFDINQSKGAKRYVIRVNGEPADFNAKIKKGDQLELYWE